jgi:2-polyprenyl-6-hydroxyphenyl methylase / 3-demethylubiquinone-9 3-methyltransferase
MKQDIGNQPANADQGELDKFAALASQWWDPKGPFRTLHDINPLRVDYICRQAAIEGARVLDVGCGGGLLAEALARRGARVTGIDLADANIAAAREHAMQQGLEIDYQLASAEDIAADNAGGFDVVTCLELLEHVPDPERVVAACAEAVRPGGMVFFSTINRNLKSFLLAIVAAEHLLRLIPRGTHEYLKLIRPHELDRWCRQHGLSVRNLSGLHLNPLTQSYSLGGNVHVNYLLCAQRAGDS